MDVERDEGPEPAKAVYDLEKVLRDRDRLVDEAAFGYDYLTAEGEDFWGLVREVSTLLKGVPQRTLADSMFDLVGRQLTPELLNATMWRLAGNVRELRAGRAVLPWTLQKQAEWMPMQVVLGEPGRNHKDEPGCWFTFRIMAGSACPLYVQRFWSKRQCAFFARSLGFTSGSERLKKRMRWEHPLQLVGLRLYGLFGTDHRPGRPTFGKIYASGTLLRYNRSILEMRYRYEPCPLGYVHACHNCAIGYAGEDGCPAACHPGHWVEGDCPDCRLQGVLFEDTLSKDRCVACERKRRMSRR